MDNNFDMDKALEMASKQLGVDKSALQNSNAQSLLERLTPQQRASVQNLLQDKAALQKLLSTPGAQSLLQNLMRSKG